MLKFNKVVSGINIIKAARGGKQSRDVSRVPSNYVIYYLLRIDFATESQLKNVRKIIKLGLDYPLKNQKS